MRILQEFEKRLEGAVEGFFARAFRSGLQPVELAKALQRYAEDNQQVTTGGVVVPNVYRFTVSSKDRARLGSFGESLERELAGVVDKTARQRGWALRGDAQVEITEGDDVTYGMFELTARVDETASAGASRSGDAGAAAAAPPQAPAPDSSPDTTDGGGAPSLRLPDGRTVRLEGERMVVGRLPSSDIALSDTTVSREHATLVRRASEWWVLDLGSTNGTRVNGQAAAEQPVHVGDQITFGEAAVTVVES